MHADRATHESPARRTVAERLDRLDVERWIDEGGRVASDELIERELATEIGLTNRSDPVRRSRELSRLDRTRVRALPGAAP